MRFPVRDRAPRQQPINRRLLAGVLAAKEEEPEIPPTPELVGVTLAAERSGGVLNLYRR